MQIPTHDELIEGIDAFLGRHSAITESRIGRDVNNEPGLIGSIRNGRSPSLNLCNKLRDYMADQDAALSAAVSAESSGNEADLSGAGSIAVCTVCDLAAGDPATRTCTAPDCGLAAKAAA